jgi:hypothetical protein
MVSPYNEIEVSQVLRHSPHAVERRRRIFLVQRYHHGLVTQAWPDWPVMQRRPAQSQQFRLPAPAERAAFFIKELLAGFYFNRSSFFFSQSFSIFNSPTAL